MNSIFKYPRTQHLAGSRKQSGDEDLDAMAIEPLWGSYWVVEEKMDGANCAISFSDDGELLLQSRGHYLTGGPAERHFDLFKSWAAMRVPALKQVLGQRYVLYGEWLFAKHTCFYDRLPHYFMEFDVLDKESGIFLSTKARRELLEPLPFIVSVKVLFEGIFTRKHDLDSWVTHSHFISDQHFLTLRQVAQYKGLRAEQVEMETDPSVKMEGLYIKHESETEVLGRYKYVRADFLQRLMASNSHWQSRPIIPNQLAQDVDIFA
jgi:hypothetical protein